MKTMIIAAAMSLCVVSLAAVAAADTLIMRDGTRVEGIVTGIAGRTITFRHADGVSRRYPTSQVASLEFFSADRANPRAASGRTLDAPAGTELVVRTIETIDSRNSVANQPFSALVGRAVSDASGRVIIPEGSSAQLVSRRVSFVGRSGSPELALDLTSITVEGRRYLVSTADLTEDSDTDIGTNRRIADTVGVGAAVGTIVGASTAASKDAALGGPIGVGGGPISQVITKGRAVKIPAETVLRFRLDQPITLRAEP